MPQEKLLPSQRLVKKLQSTSYRNFLAVTDEDFIATLQMVIRFPHTIKTTSRPGQLTSEDEMKDINNPAKEKRIIRA